MSGVNIERVVNKIEIETNKNVVEVLQEVSSIEVSKVGEQGRTGDTGAGVPAGGTARQSLNKIDGTDYNTQWLSNWFDYATNVEYNGTETAIASGDVLECVIDATTIYRFINSTSNVNGYPLEDSFYSSFDGTDLTNLIVTRG